MKNLIKVGSLIVLLFPYYLNATDPKFEIEQLADESGKVIQSLVFVSEKDYLATVPESLKPLMNLPPIKHTIIEPARVFEFTRKGVEQKFYPVQMDSYAILEAKDFHTIPYILTSDLCECLGVSLYVKDGKAGVMHVGFQSLDEQLLDEFLNHFSCYNKSIVTVRIMTSYYSVVLQEVCSKLTKCGFKTLEADIVPIYLDCKNRTSSGTKYYNYEKMGWTPDEAKAIRALPEEQGIESIESISGLNTIFCESRRVLILDARDGSSCQFFPVGYGEANSNLVHMFYKTIHMLNMVLPLSKHKMLFDNFVLSFKERYEKILSEKRKQALEYEQKRKLIPIPENN